MSPLAIVSVVAALVVLGVIALVTLAVLAGGRTGPRRFALAPPADPTEFLASAPWGATVSIDLPDSPSDVWKQVLDGPTLGASPVLSGPTANGDDRVYRGLVAFTSHVVEQNPHHGLIATGSGISIPLAIKSFAERWSVTQNGTGSTLTYTVAVAPRFIGFLPLRWTAVFAKPFIKFGVRRAF